MCVHMCDRDQEIDHAGFRGSKDTMSTTDSQFGTRENINRGKTMKEVEEKTTIWAKTIWSP